MDITKLTTNEQIAYLIKPILKVLQDAGGQLDRSEIVDKITELDEDIAEFASKVYTSQSTGRNYKKFNFKFNFAIKDLSFADYLTFVKRNPIITLTEKGLNADLESLDVMKDIIEPSEEIWKQLSEKNKEKKTVLEEDEDNQEEDEVRISDNFNTTLENAIANMSPKKFEVFSRALLNKMGVEFSEKGIQVSNDGGIDGYGYHVDKNDFRTTRVVIQCKRYNVGPVGEPEINQFLGAMNKYQADYGVFITNGRYTNAARAAAREGSPITLIDGNDLIRLVIQYELYITPVKTYVLDDFYTSE